LPLPNGPPPSDFEQAIKAWNLLGCAEFGDGLAVISEMLGIEDIELLIRHLVLIRDSQRG
jgi:hypothetical protein